MKIYQLMELLRTFDPELRVYVSDNHVAREIHRVTWSAVDPSLGRPETVLIEVKEGV